MALMSRRPIDGPLAPVSPVLVCEAQSRESDSARQGVTVTAAVVRAVLKGKEIGLLCDDPSRPEALVAYRAAIELGAHVSLVRPRFEELGETDAMREAARMLGRLYDGVACIAISSAVIDQLRALAGVPVIVEPETALNPVTAMPHVGMDTDRFLSWQSALIAGFASA